MEEYMIDQIFLKTHLPLSTPTNISLALGRPLIVGIPTKPYAPYVMPCAWQQLTLSSTYACRRPGYAAEVMHAILQRLKIPYQLVPLDDRGFGSELANGTWTGMLGRVNEGIVDTYVAEMTPIAPRLGTFLFTTPYSLTSDMAAVPGLPPPLTLIAIMGQLFSMFRIQMWLAVMVICIVSGVLILGYNQVLKRSVSAKVVKLVIGLSAALFMNLYIALLLSSLITSGQQGLITDVDSLITAIGDRRLQLMTEDEHTALYQRILHAPVSELSANVKRLREAVQRSNGVHVIEGEEDKYEYVERGVGAVVSTSRLLLAYRAAERCDVKVIDFEIFGMTYETFPFVKEFNPVVLSAINKVIQDSQQLFLQMQHRYRRPTSGPVCNPSHPTTAPIPKLTMFSFLGLLIVFGTGCSLAGCALGLERRGRRRDRAMKVDGQMEDWEEVDMGNDLL